MAINKRLIPFLLIIIFCVLTFSLPSQVLVHKHLTLQDGLIQSQIRSFYEDSRGYLWIGTMNGISRWNGNSFKNYHPYEGLPSSIVYKFHEMKSGIILVCTHNGVAAIKEDSIVEIGIFEKLKEKSIADICVSKAGTIFVGTWGNGLYILKNHKIDSITTDNGLNDNYIHDLEFDFDGNLLVATDLGLNVVNGTVKKIYSREDGLQSDYVHTLIRDGDRILIGTTRGINALKNNRIITLFPEHEFKEMMSMFLASDGSLYCGTWGYGARVFKDDKSYKLTVKNGLVTNHVFSFYEDQHKQIYIGQDGGLSIYKPGLMETFDKRYMNDPDVWSMIRISSGDYLFATNTGLEKYDGNTFSSIPLPGKLKRSGAYALAETKDGMILVGTQLGIFQLINNRLVRNPLFKKLENMGIFDIKQHPDGDLYIATYGYGVCKLSAGQLTCFNTQNKFPTNLFFKISFGASGEVFLASDGSGLIKMKDDSYEILNKEKGLLNDIVYYAKQVKNGDLWICTDEGLSVYSNGKFKNIKKLNDIPFHSTLWILEDYQERKYLGTGNGLIIIEGPIEEPYVRQLTTDDGLACIEINQGACMQEADGSIWLGTLKGISHYSPENPYQVKTSPKVRIDQVFVNEERVSAKSMPAQLSLNHDQNYIRFEYSAIDLTASAAIKYRFKLAGIDPQWNVSERNSVQYTNLDPGDYTFEVMACNTWGIWSAAQKLEIQIQPAWWQTYWAYGFYVVSIILLTFGFIHFRLRRERERSAYKEAQLQARAAEADKKAVIAEKRLRDDELERAREIQSMMLPQKSPELSFAEIETYLETAQEVGGAYFDFFIQNERSMYAVLGDATGHGIPAGMMVSLTKSSLKTMGQRPTQLILKRLNYVLKDIIPSKLQMSLNVLLIQPDRIEFSSASMPPVLIYQKDKNKIEEFSTGDFPLGYMEETSYHSNTVPFVSGDVIVMFTSSYPDTTNLSNEPLGFEAIEKMVQENVHLSAKELLDKLVHLSKWYSQNKKLVDDVAIMVIKHL